MSTENTLSLEDSLQIALTLYNRGDFQNSLSLCTQILSLFPHCSDAWNIAGLNVLALKLPDKAIGYFTEAYTHRALPSYLINLAEAHRRNHEPRESIRILAALLEHDSCNPLLLYNLARAFQDAGDPQESLRFYQKTLQYAPEDRDALYNLANLLSCSSPKEALEFYQKAAMLSHPYAAQNQARLLVEMDLLEEALALYRSLLAKEEKNHELWFNYANALALHASYAQAKEAYQKAIHLSPQSSAYRLNLAYLHLRLGELGAGFELYEARRELEGVTPNLSSLWQPGESLEGKRILLYHEQGLGDTLMFSRFIPLLEAKASSVLFLPQRPLTPLFTKALIELPPKESYDIALPLPSLPLALHLTSPLAPPPKESRRALSRRIKVGFVCASHSNFPGAKEKSIDPRILLESLQGLPFALHSFQVEGIDVSLIEAFGLVDIGSTLRDFKETQESLLEMDYFITIDTAIAHLIGNLGMEAALLLPKRADWRWEIKEHSSWHPSLRLFRQVCLGSWEEPLSELREYLEERWNAK